MYAVVRDIWIPQSPGRSNGSGVPVVTSPDAVYGMEFKDGEGLLFGRDEKDLAAKASLLLTDSVFANEQSRLARKQVERLCTLENTYGRLVRELFDWLLVRDSKTS